MNNGIKFLNTEWRTRYFLTNFDTIWASITPNTSDILAPKRLSRWPNSHSIFNHASFGASKFVYMMTCNTIQEIWVAIANFIENDHHHYREVTWVSCCLKSPTIRLFVLQFVCGYNSENIRAPFYLPLVRETTGLQCFNPQSLDTDLQCPFYSVATVVLLTLS